MAKFEQIKNRKQQRIRSSSANPNILLEAQMQPLYAKKSLTTPGAQTVQMFLNLSSTNADDTNLTQPSVPNPSEFEVYGVSLFIDPSTSIADFHNLINNGALEFAVSGKTYLQIPLHQLPSGGGTSGIVATTVNNERIQSIQNGPQGAVYRTDWNGQPIHIQSLEAFSCDLKTFSTTNFSGTIDVTVIISGVYWKPLV